MPIFGRRAAPPESLDSELERIRAIRTSAEQELGRLRRELAERVAAVEQRERELADAIGRVRRDGRSRGDQHSDTASRAEVVLAARAQELARREEELAVRERVLVEQENDATRRGKGAATPEERLAEIEERLATLQEAEKAFVRTRAELAARSDDLDRRAALLKESARAGFGGSVLNSAELAEIDERLRRLERETREASTERGFGADLRALESKGGLRGPGA